MPIQDIDIRSGFFEGASILVEFESSSEIVLNVTRMEYSAKGNISGDDFLHYMMFMFILGNEVEETVNAVQECREFMDIAHPEMVSYILTKGLEEY